MDSNSNNLADTRKSRKTACVHCRQSKLRCNSTQRPCSRCERLGLSCEVVRGYKRVNKTLKVTEMQQEVEQLKSVVSRLSAAQSTIPQNDLQQLGRGVSQEVILQQATPGFTPSSSHARSTLNPDSSTLSITQASSPDGSSFTSTLPRSIDGLEISPEKIDDLFQAFFTKYHRFIPLLDASHTPNHYYNSSPLLFFAICSIASRRPIASHSTNLESLSNSVISLAWVTISSASALSMASIQALVILSTWQYYAENTSKENALHFSAICIASSQKMGLHRPSNPEDFGRLTTDVNLTISDHERLERLQTWAACNVVSHKLSIDFGLPPTAIFDNALRQASASSIMPKSLRHLLCVQLFVHRSTRLLSFDLPIESERSHLLSVLDEDCFSLERKLSEETLDAVTRLEILYARLELQAYAFLDPVGIAGRKLGILRAYAAASTYISELLAFDTREDLVIYMPESYVRRLFNAACILLRVLSTRLALSIDASSGAVLFHSAVSALRRYTLHPTDLLSSRLIEVLSYHWRTKETEENSSMDDEPVLRVRSRAGASVLYDCAWRWKQHCQTQNDPDQFQPPSNMQEQNFADTCWLWDFGLDMEMGSFDGAT